MPERHWRYEDPAFVKNLVVEMWTKAGASREHAEAIAWTTTTADALGKYQQGISVLEVLYPSLVAGDLNLKDDPEVVREGNAWFVMDGRRSTGHYAVTLAMKRAIEVARDSGICIGLCRNHWDAGCFGSYALLAAEHGMFGLATNGTEPLTTPIGGALNVMGCAPLAAAGPTDDLPILVDIKTADTYDGEMLELTDSGERYEAPVFVDPETKQLTDDPAPYVVRFDGPFTRYAGFRCATTFTSHRLQALNILVDMLNALTPGGNVTPDLPVDALEWERGRDDLTMVPASVVLVINPNVMSDDPAEYRAKLTRYRDAVKGVEHQPGTEPIRMPGETGARRLRDGAPLPILESHWSAFIAWAERLGVDVAKVASRTSSEAPDSLSQIGEN